MKYKLLNALLLTAMAAAFAPASVATTWYVDGVSGNDGNNCTSAATACKTIGHAIEAAVSGDSIIVAPATYIENLTISKSLTILGSDASTTIMDGGFVGSVVTIPNNGIYVTLSNLTVRHGLAVSGGGILNSGAKLTISHSIISQNGATGRGGSIGGGILNNGTLTVSHSTLSGNWATGTQKEFAHGYCGAIANNGSVAIGYSTISGNSALGLGGTGGGICNGGTLIVSHSTISGNSAFRDGGISSGGILVLNDSTISGNSALVGGGGVNNTGGRMTISNSTISGNSSLAKSPVGGGGMAGTGTVRNSIVANNSRKNCDSTMTSNGYNLSSDGSCDFDGTGDRNYTDPKLGPLQNNGGPTQTMALLPGSPAIDAGNSNGCRDNHGNLLKTDQRGMPRHDPEDTRGCDMGAYESQSD